MYCKECGVLITNSDSEFCEKCGSKIIKEENVNTKVNLDSKMEANKKGQPFLISSIILAVCCCQIFGIIVILLNELKYKPLLIQGKLDEANRVKTWMIILLCVGLIGGLAMGVLFFFFEILASV